MAYQVALSASARRDLRSIVRFISVDSPDRAARFGQLLIDQTKRLADFPELGRVVPEFEDTSVREIVVRSYRIIYRVDHDLLRIDVVRFWHAARGVPEVDNS